jgi:hypothetical protein
MARYLYIDEDNYTCISEDPPTEEDRIGVREGYCSIFKIEDNQITELGHDHNHELNFIPVLSATIEKESGCHIPDLPF